MRFQPFQQDMGLFNILEDLLRDADPEGIPMPMFMQAITDAQLFGHLGIQT